VLFKGAALSGFAQFVQRNRRFKGEGARFYPPQHGDVADGAKRARDVAGEGADVSALETRAQSIASSAATAMTASE